MGKKFHLVIFLVLMIATFGCSSESKSLKVSPSSVDFQSVNLGDKITQDIVLTNKYGKDILISTIALSGSSDYTILNGGITPVQLANKAQLTVTVQFEPTTAGVIIGLISITTDASSKVKDISITGVGVPVPRIELSETSYDFKKKIINKTHTHDFVIKNIGTSDLDISSMTFTGLGASTYSITMGNAPINMQPGTIHTFTVTFAPLVIGNFPADLMISHNAVNEVSPSVVNLSGEGIDVDPQITFSQPTPWDFGTVGNTKPSVQYIELSSTGLDPLTITSASLATGAEFTIDSVKDENGNSVSLPQTLAVGKKLIIGIKFSPTANVKYYDTLSIGHDGTNEVSPFDIALEGEGRIIITKTFVNVGTDKTGSIQSWTVPAGVTLITIEAWGAEGGAGTYNGGKGARMKGDFTVTPGDVIKIVVGHKGDQARYSSGTPGAGGGGGTFVWLDSSTTLPLIAAGGGGGGSSGSAGMDGDKGTTGGTPTGAGAGGTGGNGGANCTENCGGAGGAGWLSDGGSQSCAGSYMNYGGKTKMSFEGGYSTYTSNGGGSFGGFGGGGGALRGGAGGGGYSGGGGGKNSIGQGGGGGASYNSGTSQSNDSGIQTGHGKVVIEY